MNDERTDNLMPMLLKMYVPVMLLSLVLPAAAGFIAALLIGKWWALALPVLFVLLSGLHLLYLFQLSRKKLKRERDWFEMKLDAEEKVKLREFVFEIARRWETPRPEDIRLSALSAAHVYESKKGKRVLVIGGMALAALSKEALGAVLAHELNHFAGGDTAKHWENLAGFTMMSRLGALFRRGLGHHIDPAVWVLAAYQWFVELRYARHSREREFACDARSAEHAGPVPTAAALIYLHALEEMPWANTMDVLAMTAGVGTANTDVFTEQARRAATAHPDDWAEATETVMQKRTRALDSHPCLRERLEAIDATEEEGLEYLLSRESPPARTLMRDWRAVERKLSVKLTSAYQIWRENRYGWGGLTLSEPEE
ncbi:MAG: M48 family metallopeptidase [Gemmataceae bacterium]